MHFYYRVPDLLIIAMAWLLIAGAVTNLLPLTVQHSWPVRIIRRLVRPIMGFSRWITPSIVPGGMVFVAAVVWLMLARILWYLACTAAGMRVSLGG
jgi:hypothetical protein